MTAPRVWRLGTTAHLTRLSYAIDYAQYDVGNAQVLRMQAPGVGPWRACTLAASRSRCRAGSTVFGT